MSDDNEGVAKQVGVSKKEASANLNDNTQIYSVKIKGENPTDTTTTTKTTNESSTLTERKKKKRRKTFKESDDKLDEFVPSSERKTDRGGYAHTNRSKRRISEANRGNTPWNKGRVRSSADKAKIAAGVRARNRAVLLEKLKRLGMTEEEWFQKKKEVKYLRERVRRAKAANEKHKMALAEQQLKAALEETIEKAVPEKETSEQGADQSRPASSAAQTKNNTTTENDTTAKNKTTTNNNNNRKSPEVFCRDYIWKPHEYDDTTHVVFCPDGGPGGLICCESCSKSYSSFLSQTIKDIETQRTYKAGNEVKELIQCVEEGLTSLDRATKAARKADPPPLVASVDDPAGSQKFDKKKNRNATQDMDITDWDMTTAIDNAPSHLEPV